jgi:hypothetical protein
LSSHRFQFLADQIREWSPDLIARQKRSADEDVALEPQLIAHVSWLESLAKVFDSQHAEQTHSGKAGGFRYTAETLLSAWQLCQVLNNAESIEKSIQRAISMSLSPAVANEILKRREAMR